MTAFVHVIAIRLLTFVSISSRYLSVNVHYKKIGALEPGLCTALKSLICMTSAMSDSGIY